MKTIRVLVVSIAEVIASACSGFGGEPGCDLCTTSAIVYGSVHGATGAPVSGASVTADIRIDSCQGMSVGSLGGPSIADALGVYHLRARSLSAPAAACLLLTVQPPTGSGLRAIVDTGHVVRLQADWPSGAVLDSVRVDFVIPPAA
jgi:hypothetical protein